MQKASTSCLNAMHLSACNANHLSYALLTGVLDTEYIFPGSALRGRSNTRFLIILVPNGSLIEPRLSQAQQQNGAGTSEPEAVSLCEDHDAQILRR